MANIYQGRLARLRMIQEASFGTDGSGTLGNYTDIPAIMDSIKPVRDEKIVQPGHVIQRLDQRDLGIAMPRIDTKLPFTTNVETVDTKAGSGVTITQHGLGLLLECGLGGKFLGTGSTISGAASTTTVVNVTSAAGFRAGGALGIINTSVTPNKFEMREIKSITGNAITLKMALGMAPVTPGAVVYGCATYYLHNNPAGADPKYAQFLVEGYNPKDRWMFPGGALESFGISGFEPAGIPRFDWGFQHPTWLPADGVNTVANLRDSTLGLVAYTNVRLSTVRDADIRLRSLASSALPGFLNAPKINISPNVRYEALRTPGSGLLNSTCFGYRRVEVYEEPAVKLDIEAHWENDTVLDDYHAAGTLLHFNEQIGNVVTGGVPIGGVLLSIPRLQIMQAPQEIMIGGVRGKGLELYSLHDTDTTAAGGATADDTALSQAAIRFHFA